MSASSHGQVDGDDLQPTTGVLGTDIGYLPDGNAGDACPASALPARITSSAVAVPPAPSIVTVTKSPGFTSAGVIRRT